MSTTTQEDWEFALVRGNRAAMRGSYKLCSGQQSIAQDLIYIALSDCGSMMQSVPYYSTLSDMCHARSYVRSCARLRWAADFGEIFGEEVPGAEMDANRLGMDDDVQWAALAQLPQRRATAALPPLPREPPTPRPPIPSYESPLIPTEVAFAIFYPLFFLAAVIYLPVAIFVLLPPYFAFRFLRASTRIAFRLWWQGVVLTFLLLLALLLLSICIVSRLLRRCTEDQAETGQVAHTATKARPLEISA